MSQHISGNITSNCYVGSHSHVNRRQRSHLSFDTSNLSSAVQIGQRLAVIGDEFNRAYEARIPNKMAHIIRESMYVYRSEPGRICHSLLLLAALAAVCGLLIKLGLDSIGRL
ncbi:hypothetical protein AB205_0136500 [Aquarana catesbeiana]|uniref:Uncharacterized protein n=1 Tax=Aquarana catesbeiana TaxID=8400 RepID=A0A2G9RQA7_AQUCT|nr:hypothetical protein AB205_0136500 [Aquarana catesbeiana]